MPSIAIMKLPAELPQQILSSLHGFPLRTCCGRSCRTCHPGDLVADGQRQEWTLHTAEWNVEPSTVNPRKVPAWWMAQIWPYVGLRHLDSGHMADKVHEPFESKPFEPNDIRMANVSSSTAEITPLESYQNCQALPGPRAPFLASRIRESNAEDGFLALFLCWLVSSSANRGQADNGTG